MAHVAALAASVVDGKGIAHAAPSFLDVTGAVVLAADDTWLTIDRPRVVIGDRGGVSRLAP